MNLEQNIECPTCHYIIETDIYFKPNYCSKCGTEITNIYLPEHNYCPACCPNGPTNAYEELMSDDKFCPICGKKTILYDEIISQKN